jgi:hypothetical protein
MQTTGPLSFKQTYPNATLLIRGKTARKEPAEKKDVSARKIF